MLDKNDDDKQVEKSKSIVEPSEGDNGSQVELEEYEEEIEEIIEEIDEGAEDDLEYDDEEGELQDVASGSRGDRLGVP